MKMRAVVFAASLLVLGVALSPAAFAQGKPAPQPSPEMIQAGFLNAHPDLLWRTRGMDQYRAERFDEAFTRFQRAARYADKPSQGLVAEMYWTGRGVPQDRPLAYAWMDLAAERFWRPFLIRREIYWQSMSADERKQAIDVGKTLYAEFGDAVAKPRKAQVLRRERGNVTGSRTGFAGNVSIEIPSAGGSIRISGAEFYNPMYWDVDKYWAWQESVWKEARPGLVEVGPVSTPTPPSGQAEDKGTQ